MTFYALAALGLSLSACLACVGARLLGAKDEAAIAIGFAAIVFGAFVIA